jgi:hypothetical protein
MFRDLNCFHFCSVAKDILTRFSVGFIISFAFLLGNNQRSELRFFLYRNVTFSDASVEMQREMKLKVVSLEELQSIALNININI